MNRNGTKRGFGNDLWSSTISKTKNTIKNTSDIDRDRDYNKNENNILNDKYSTLRNTVKDGDNGSETHSGKQKNNGNESDPDDLMSISFVSKSKRNNNDTETQSSTNNQSNNSHHTKSTSTATNPAPKRSLGNLLLAGAKSSSLLANSEVVSKLDTPDLDSQAQTEVNSEIMKHYFGAEKTVTKPAKRKSKYQVDWDLSENTNTEITNNKSKPAPSSTSTTVVSSGLNKFYIDRDLEDLHRKTHAKKITDQTLVRQQLYQHWSDKPLADMTERDWRILKEDYSIFTHGTNVPNPLRSWSEAPLAPAILQAVAQAKFSEPSPIQRASIPVGLANRDIMGIAETGSGKTVAFLFPLLMYILSQPKMTLATVSEGPHAVILAPVRELAQQIHAQAEMFGGVVGISSVCVVGGQNIKEDIMKLNHEVVEIVIGTPGRIVDLLSERYLVLNRCNYIIIDEADRMLEMGFEMQLNTILDAMPSSNIRPADNTNNIIHQHQHHQLHSQTYRQTVMFSATMPQKVKMLAQKYLRSPIEIRISGGSGRTNPNITQVVEWVSNRNKLDKLKGLLRQYRGPVLIFCNRRNTCDYLSNSLHNTPRHQVTVLHSGKSQDQRESILAQFKDGKYSVLITTDVMGRGIDVSGVELVVNYELPDGHNAIERYTHRIGRTGRGGQKGTAVSFLNDDDKDIMYDLKELLLENKSAVPPQLAKHEATKDRNRKSDYILW